MADIDEPIIGQLYEFVPPVEIDGKTYSKGTFIGIWINGDYHFFGIPEGEKYAEIFPLKRKRGSNRIATPVKE